MFVDGCSVNLTELNQAPDQSLEEPKAAFESAQEGKPRCVIPLFLRYFTSNYSLYVVIILFAHLRS